MTTIPDFAAPATGLTTDRLQLDVMSTAEVDALIIQKRLPDWAGDFPQPADHDAARQYFEEGLMTAVGALSTRLIRERATSEVVGTIGFLRPTTSGTVEVSYSVAPSRRGRGYAAEALIAVSRHALQQPDVDEVTAYTETDNEASQSLLLTAGFLPVETPGMALAFALRRSQVPEANR